MVLKVESVPLFYLYNDIFILFEAGSRYSYTVLCINLFPVLVVHEQNKAPPLLKH